MYLKNIIFVVNIETHFTYTKIYVDILFIIYNILYIIIYIGYIFIYSYIILQYYKIQKKLKLGMLKNMSNN